MVFIMTVILLKIYSMTIKERFEKIKKNVLGSSPLPVIHNFCKFLSNLIFSTTKDTIYISRVNPLIRGAYVDIELREAQAISEIILTTRSSPQIHEPAR